MHDSDLTNRAFFFLKKKLEFGSVDISAKSNYTHTGLTKM